MDVVARYFLVMVSGALFAFGPMWLHVSCLVLFLSAASAPNKHKTGLCIVYYAVALCPLLPIAFDYSSSIGYSILAYGIPLVLNAGVVSLALLIKTPYRGMAVASAILFLSVPPLAVLSPVSPIPVAGLLFPGLGSFGIVLFLLLLGFCATGIRPLAAGLGLLVFSFSQSHAGELSQQVLRGVDTNRGAPTQIESGVFAQLHRNEERDIALSANADVIVFPESTFGQWHPSYSKILSNETVRILGGARHYLDERHYVNVLIDGATGDVIYAQQSPIPFGVNGRDKAVAGKEVSSSDEYSVIICNEVANAWRSYQTFSHAKNGSVIWIANFGWTDSGYVIKRAIANANHWSRLFGVPVIQAVNHHA